MPARSLLDMTIKSEINRILREERFCYSFEQVEALPRGIIGDLQNVNATRFLQVHAGLTRVVDRIEAWKEGIPPAAQGRVVTTWISLFQEPLDYCWSYGEVFAEKRRQPPQSSFDFFFGYSGLYPG